MQEFFSNSTEHTEQIACNFAKHLVGGDIVAYIGGLGVGKTAFTRGLAKGLKVTGEVSSPTFSLVHEYHGDINLYHFDMYRINSTDDLYSTGYFEYLDEKQIIAVEWSENIDYAFDDKTIFVDISLVDDYIRSIKIFDGGNRF